MPRKSGNRLEDEYIHYVATVTGWEHLYGLSVGGPGEEKTESYNEISVLKFCGKIIRPKGFKYTNSEVNFSARRDILDKEAPPQQIGMLTGRNEILEAYVFVPNDRMAELLTLAVSERLQAIMFSGSKLKRRRGLIYGIEMMTEFSEKDWSITSLVDDA